MTDVENVSDAQKTSTGGRAATTVVRGALGLVASAVRLITGLFATILVVNIVLILLGANPFNAFARLIFILANALTLGLRNLFLLQNPIWQVILAYGVPAVVWMLIGSLVVAVLRAIARPKSGLA